MKWLKRLLIALLLLVALLAVPYFVPLSTYIPLLESALSERLHQPVTVSALKVAGMPLPHLILQDVRIGRPALLSIRSVKVVPELHTLLEDVKVLSVVELTGAAADEEALKALPQWLASGDAPRRVRIKRVKLSDGYLRLKNFSLGPFNAAADLKPEGALEVVQMDMLDGSLSVKAKPGKKDFLLDVRAKNWTPPLQPGLRFDALTLQGRADANEMTLDRIRAELYGGTLTGKAHLSWRKQWRLDGELSSREVEIERLAAIVAPQTKITGKMTARLKFAASGSDAARLPENPSADMDFLVKNGVLYNMDIAKAAQAKDKKAVQGGETRFEHFSGKLHLADRVYQLRELKLESGMLDAAGALDIAPDKKLSGMIQVQLKGSANLVGMPLAVGGTLQDPTLRPTTGTMAGAAVGTLLLGPGMGTSLGMRAGQWLEKLFGKKDAPPPPAKKSK